MLFQSLFLGIKPPELLQFQKSITSLAINTPSRIGFPLTKAACDPPKMLERTFSNLLAKTLVYILYTEFTMLRGLNSLKLDAPSILEIRVIKVQFIPLANVALA